MENQTNKLHILGSTLSKRCKHNCTHIKLYFNNASQGKLQGNFELKIWAAIFFLWKDLFGPHIFHQKLIHVGAGKIPFLLAGSKYDWKIYLLLSFVMYTPKWLIRMEAHQHLTSP